MHIKADISIRIYSFSAVNTCVRVCTNGFCMESSNKNTFCTCKENFDPTEDPDVCFPQQLCGTETATCPENSVCVNEQDGTYSCVCQNGYELVNDTCQGTGSLKSILRCTLAHYTLNDGHTVTLVVIMCKKTLIFFSDQPVFECSLSE